MAPENSVLYYGYNTVKPTHLEAWVMTDSLEDERARIRAEKERTIQRQLEDGESAAHAPDEPIAIRDVEHFDAIVADHHIVLVDCYADWCGPCRMLEPTVEALAAESPATVAKVDVDRLPHLAQRFGVRGVPTIVFYVDGRPEERLVGVQDRQTLEDTIDQYV